MTVSTLQCGPTEICYSETGSGTPVVFLHGAGLTHRLWEPQIDHLSASYRCYALDLRGHGGSSHHAPGHRYSIADHAEDVAAFVDAAGIDRAHFIGLSLGGMVVLEFGLLHPERVISLVTMGTPVDSRPNPLAAAALDAGSAYMYRRIRSGGMAWAARVGAKWWTRVPEVRAYMLEDTVRNDPEEFRRVWEGVVEYRIKKRLSEMRPPVLVVAGSRDWNRRQARAGASLIPKARFELIRGGGHIINRDEPQRINALLAEWLGSFE